jgi:hypothetical protein
MGLTLKNDDFTKMMVNFIAKAALTGLISPPASDVLSNRDGHGVHDDSRKANFIVQRYTNYSM